MNEEVLAMIAAAVAGYKERAERSTSATWTYYNRGASDALEMLMALLKSKE